MRPSLVLAALLYFTIWMSVGHATNGPVASCCLRWSDTLQRVPLEQILDYTIQSEGICPITAVVFLTKLGKRICSDPNSNRAKRAILKVDKEKKKKEALQEKRQNEEGLTSDITPTVSTTAIVFQTKRGVGISSDPNSDPAKEAILKVDEKEKGALQEQGQNEEGLTSDITPTVSTTAVMFQTKSGVRIFSDPNSDPAKEAVQKVDEEKKGALQEQGQNEEGLTSDITPTVSTTAVMLQTKSEVGIFSNPNSDPAKEAILKVDEEKKGALQEKGQNEEGLTSDITPTVSTTAVVFQTKPGVRISSDPNSDRAEKSILNVDEEKKEVLQGKGQNEEGLTSDITAAVSTTSKKTPQKKGRHRRRRQKKKSRRWKKAQRKRP